MVAVVISFEAEEWSDYNTDVSIELLDELLTPEEMESVQIQVNGVMQ